MVVFSFHENAQIFFLTSVILDLIIVGYLSLNPYQCIFLLLLSFQLAQKELQKINMYKAPRDKLVCILNCCKVINNLLLNASVASNDNPPGADEFLPVLIYVTLKVWQTLYNVLIYLIKNLLLKQYISSSILNKLFN